MKIWFNIKRVTLGGDLNIIMGDLHVRDAVQPKLRCLRAENKAGLEAPISRCVELW